MQSMQALERTAVQLAEARRLAAYDDVPHGRLALLLLDNAAETILRRTVGDVMFWGADLAERLLRHLRDVNVDSDEEAKAFVRELEGKTLSKKDRWRIDHYFDPLVDYVFSSERWALDPVFAHCLKALHNYRNDAYHRDIVRTDVLGPAVQIYFYLCCQLLKAERPMMSQLGRPPPGVLEIFDGQPPTADETTDRPPRGFFKVVKLDSERQPRPGSWPERDFDSKQLGDLVADRLLEQMELDHAHIANALSSHLTSRLSALDEYLDSITSHFMSPTRDFTLRLVQLAPTDPDCEEDDPEDFWTRELPVTQDVLEAWKAKAQHVRDIPVAVDALSAFAAIEEQLSTLEEPVDRFVVAIDHDVQRRIDEARGK